MSFYLRPGKDMERQSVKPEGSPRLIRVRRNLNSCWMSTKHKTNKQIEKGKERKDTAVGVIASGLLQRPSWRPEPPQDHIVLFILLLSTTIRGRYFHSRDGPPVGCGGDFLPQALGSSEPWPLRGTSFAKLYNNVPSGAFQTCKSVFRVRPSLSGDGRASRAHAAVRSAMQATRRKLSCVVTMSDCATSRFSGFAIGIKTNLKNEAIQRNANTCMRPSVGASSLRHIWGRCFRKAAARKDSKQLAEPNKMADDKKRLRL